jgi:hypothetical protein
MHALIYLLKREVEALRSVLSELEEDKSCYNQMILADDLRRIIEEIFQ